MTPRNPVVYIAGRRPSTPYRRIRLGAISLLRLFLAPSQLIVPQALGRETDGIASIGIAVTTVTYYPAYSCHVFPAERLIPNVSHGRCGRRLTSSQGKGILKQSISRLASGPTGKH